MGAGCTGASAVSSVFSSLVRVVGTEFVGMGSFADLIEELQKPRIGIPSEPAGEDQIYRFVEIGLRFGNIPRLQLFLPFTKLSRTCSTRTSIAGRAE